jgi:DNA-binding CsgD family transcriptional regulator
LSAAFAAQPIGEPTPVRQRNKAVLMPKCASLAAIVVRHRKHLHGAPGTASRVIAYVFARIITINRRRLAPCRRAVSFMPYPERFDAEPTQARQRDSDEDRLLIAVVAFFAEGLRSGEPVIAIATESEFSAIARRLAAASIDIEQARHTGELTFVDAQKVLDLVIIRGEPDAVRFSLHVGTVIDDVLRGRAASLTRVYSGMVDLLSTRGQADAAAQLERSFYGLARTHAFSLLCAHAMREFYKDGERPRRQFDAIEAGVPGAAAAGEAPGGRTITKREGDVLRRTALGHANKDIANALNISVRTVEAHKAHAMRKLGLIERTDMIRFAISKGWLTAGYKGPG